MLLPTHLIFAQTTFLAACVATGHAPSHLESLGAMLAACLPDLDKRQSYLGRLAWPLAGWLEIASATAP